MKIQTTRARLLASSMICGIAALAGSQAFAQQAGGGGEIVVTGSRIPSPNLTSTSPISVVSNQDVKLQGTTQTADLLNQLPQVFASMSANISNGGTGTANVNLRGLGTQRTLVLIDGKRLGPGDPTLNGASSPDINFIPAALIDHVEVLTGGASAVYGSDAIAGVVNFIMMKNFEGVRLNAQASTYQHNNGNSAFQALEQKKGDFAPSGSIWDGRKVNLSAVVGVNTPDGKGNATVYATYLNVQPILQSHRDYSACTVVESGSFFACRGSGTTYPADIISLDLANQGFSTYQFIVDKTTTNTLRPFNPATDTFNFGPINYYQTQDERYSAGAYAHYEVSPHFDAYAQIMFMDDLTVTQAAPSGIFGQTFEISCSNPMLSAQEIGTLCTQAGLGPTDNASLSILRRNVEGGGRNDFLRHTDYRMVLGTKGDIGNGWSYDAYGLMARSVYNENFQHDMSLSNITNALDVVNNGGTLACSNPVAVQAGCVPYNIFSTAPINPAALNYVSVPGFKSGSTTEQVLSVSATGPLPIKSPAATDGVKAAIGAEYRREALDLSVDQEFATGDLTGQGGPTKAESGSYYVKELFGEIRAPLVQDMPFFKELSAEARYRYSDYSSAGTTNTYSFALEWKPVDDIRFRGGYDRAVRTPNILELFLPSGVVLGLPSDPCSGPVGSKSLIYTAAQCLNTGVPLNNYGHVANNPAGQYNQLAGGNATLKPEKSDTWTVGAVITPHAVPGLTLSIDYFDIKVNQVISALDPSVIINACAAQDLLCNLVHRVSNNGYSLWLGTLGYVDSRNINLGYLKTDGVDFDLNYRLPLSAVHLDNYGSMTLHFTGTYLMDLITNPGVPVKNSSGALVASYNCAGLYGETQCGTPNPQWRHQARLTWNTPWSGLQVSGAWRYYGAVDFQKPALNPYFAGGSCGTADCSIPAQSYFDLAAEIKLHDHYTFRLGVNNIFDKEPPIVGSGAGGSSNAFYNGNTYPAVYDSLGRYGFIALQADF